MIIVERIEGKNLEKRYSDTGMLIRQVETGGLYAEAIDVIPCQFTYEETETPIDDEPLDPQEALNMIFGGNDDTV